MPIFDEDRKVFPTRNGVPQGHSVESKMLSMAQGADTVRTVVRTNPDGSTVMLRTRGGFPEFTTSNTRSSKTSEKLGGGFVFQPSDGIDVKRVWDDAYLQTVTHDSDGPTGRVISADQGAPSLSLHTQKPAKHVSWRGVAIDASGAVVEQLVTWDHGLKSRYRLHFEQDCSGRIIKYEGGSPIIAQSGTPGIVFNGRLIDTVYNGHSFNVVGAAVCSGMPVVVSHSHPDHLGDTDAVSRAVANSVTATVFYHDGTGWKVAGSHTASSPLKAPWFFSPDGLRAASIREPSQSNQFIMRMSLMAVGTTVVLANVSDSKLEGDQFVVETTTKPLVTTNDGVGEWQQPGEWVGEEAGTGFYTTIDAEGNATAHSLDIAWRTGTTPTAAYAVVEDMMAVINAAGRGDAYSPFVWRAPDHEVDKARITNDWSVDTYGASEVHGIGNWYGNVTAQAKYRAYRNTSYRVSLGTQDNLFTRYVRGKRTLAVDYGFDGTELIVTESLVGENTGYSTHGESESFNRIDHMSYDVVQHTAETQTRMRFQVSGSTKWKIEINGAELFTLSGGVKNAAVCSSSISRIVKSTDDQHGAYGQHHTDDYIGSYSPPATPLETERGWLIDMDARTKSCIYEKLHIDFYPKPTDGSLSVEQQAGIFGKRLECSTKSTASLHLLHKGVVAHEESFDLGTTSQYMLRPYSTMMELVPRLHDLEEMVEERTMLQFVQWTDWPAELEAYRYFYMSLDTLFDPMPRGSNRGDEAGQLQSRSDDQTAFSTSSVSTSQLLPTPSSGAEPTKLHTITFKTKVLLSGAEYQVVDQIKAKLSADVGAMDFKTPEEGFRINPVRAI